jgi:hypothetical protein
MGKVLPLLEPRGRVHRRLIASGIPILEDDPESILFQHSIFCQTGLPHRDLGDELFRERTNGRVTLSVEAGKAYDPEEQKFKQLGLPFGPKPHIILAYLNTQALRTGSPEIEVEASLTGFARRIYQHDPSGRELRGLKAQFGRLSVALICVALTEDTAAVQVQTHIITKLDLWFPMNERQRLLWPSP